jgi:predicted PurR-regulated permease PerM
MNEENPISPKWTTTTKLVVALTIAAILTALFIQFRNIVGPLMLAFVFAYLVNPVSDPFHRVLHITWRLAVTLNYFLIVVILLALATWGGFTIVEQVQSLIGFLQNAVNDLPNIIQNVASHPLHFGPFALDFTRLDLPSLSNQVLGVVQPLLARLGNLVGTFASSAAATLGWFLFMLLVSYFILSETGGRSKQLIYFHIPGYEEDLDRMGWELSRIWNAFLRGQFIIISMTVLLYTILLGMLGVHYYFGLAIVAGMARFIPYVGPFIAWTTYGLVSYFQGVSLFGMPQMTYALMIVGIAWITDNIIDSLISPRIMADALSVHPAAVMVAALVGANLLGITGVILAAPVLASLKLVMNYVVRKLSDRDPWEDVQVVSPSTKRLSQMEKLREINAYIQAAWSAVVSWSRSKVSAFRNKNHPRID